MTTNTEALASTGSPMSDTLPPLPQAAVDEHNLQGGRLLYTADQMRKYALTARQQVSQPQAAPQVSEGWKLAPHYRGYALLGTGRYLIDSTDAPADPELGAELVISIASEKDREGREIGERRDMPARTIQPEDMAVRIGFLNERGLFALEDQLWMLRQEHWPGTQSAAMRAAEPNEEREIWQAWSDSDGYSYWDTRDEAVLHDAEGSPVRFVPAEQPKGEPLTDEQITQGWACECEPGSTFDAFSSGVVFAERHHGIGASEGDGNAG